MSLVLAAFLTLAPFPDGQAGSLPDVDRKSAAELREELTEALASSDPKDWKKCVALGRKLEGKFALDSLLAVVAEGPERDKGMPKPRKVGKKKEKLEDYGSVTVGYTFEHDGEQYRYAVDVPSAYKGKEPWGLLIDPGHGSGAAQDDRGKADFLPFWRNQVEAAGLRDWLIARTEIVEQVGAGGTRGALPEDEVAAVFDAFRRDVLTRFWVDPDRIYVSGLSQTGFWSWYLGRELADRLAGIAPMGAVTWEVDRALENLLHLPTFVLHGSEDPVCPVAQPRATTSRMKELGLPVRYEEVAGAAHDFATWSHLPQGLEWLTAQERERVPRRVVKLAGTLHNPWASWLRLDELERESDGRANSAPTARVEARVDGQRIEIESTGIEELSLWLPADLVDLDQELTVVWNGDEAYRGVPERSLEVTLEAVLERCDWRTLPQARIELD